MTAAGSAPAGGDAPPVAPRSRELEARTMPKPSAVSAATRPTMSSPEDICGEASRLLGPRASPGWDDAHLAQRQHRAGIDDADLHAGGPLRRLTREADRGLAARRRRAGLPPDRLERAPVDRDGDPRAQQAQCFGRRDRIHMAG